MRNVLEEYRGGVAPSGQIRRGVGILVSFFGVLRRELGVPLALILLGLLLQGLAALFPEMTEQFYAQSLYPQLITIICWFSSPFSFSLGEALIIFLVVIALAFLVWTCALLYTRPLERSRRVLTSLRFVVWCVAVLFWSFLIAFGLNYQRPLLFELLGYEQRRASQAELETLSSLVVDRINETYAASSAVGRMVPRPEELRTLLEESYRATKGLTLLSAGVYAPPKPLYMSGIFTRLGLGGVYFPFTGEPNYNAEVPDFQMPFIMAHEMAHQRGVARESEANFVAYVVCINSPDPFVQYSGYRNALGVLSELYNVNPEKAKELSRQLGAGYRTDSRRAATFWAKASGAAGTLSLRINDIYLRANRVKNGAGDYSGSTALIIGYHLQELAGEKGSAGG